MNSLAWDVVTALICSGPVLRQHLAHPRTLNQDLGASTLPFCSGSWLSVRPPPKLTSPAVVVAVLAEDAALGVGDRCRVTSAMPAGSWRYTGRPSGLVSCERWANDTYEWWMGREMQPVQPCVAHKAPLQLQEVLAAAIRQGKVPTKGHKHETKPEVAFQESTFSRWKKCTKMELEIKHYWMLPTSSSIVRIIMTKKIHGLSG